MIDDACEHVVDFLLPNVRTRTLHGHCSPFAAFSLNAHAAEKNTKATVSSGLDQIEFGCGGRI